MPCVEPAQLHGAGVGLAGSLGEESIVKLLALANHMPFRILPANIVKILVLAFGGTLGIIDCGPSGVRFSQHGAEGRGNFPRANRPRIKIHTQNVLLSVGVLIKPFEPHVLL